MFNIVQVLHNGKYSYDDRIFSTTKGKLYNGYPNGNDSNIIRDSIEIEKKIIYALKDYKNSFYEASIQNLIKDKNMLLNI